LLADSSQNPEAGEKLDAHNDNAYEHYDMDPSLIDVDLPDFDVFELFDPDFNLDGVDACLGSYLDLSFPPQLQ